MDFLMMVVFKNLFIHFWLQQVFAAPVVAEHRLQAEDMVVALHGLHVPSSQTRDPTRVPCIRRQILNQWTTREVLDGWPF